MSRNVSLLVGQQIKTVNGVAVGRIGVVVIDKSGQPLALTARHVVLAEGVNEIQDAEFGFDLGESLALATFKPAPSDLPSTGQPPTLPFFTMIGAFAVGKGVDLASSRLVPTTGVHTDLDELVGANLVAHRPGLPTVTATVVGVGGVVRFNDPYAQETSRLREVIEIKITSDDPLRRGEAGLLFTDEYGSAVGLLMSASSPHTAYVAPLGPFLAEHGLRLISEQTAVAPSSDNDDAQHKLIVAQLDRAADANATIRKALEAEPSMHRDPAAQRVPARLLELLD